MRPPAFDPSIFRHRTPVQVRFGDIDMFQHLNNARYLTFLEQARVKYAIDVMGWDGQNHTLNMILARVELDFLKPVWLKDRVVVLTRCGRIGAKSYDFEYLIVRNDDDEVVAQAKTVLVAYDLRSGQSVPLPDALKQAMTEYEPGKVLIG